MKRRLRENGPFNRVACAKGSAHRDHSIRIGGELRIVFLLSMAALLSAACGGVTSTPSGETGGGTSSSGGTTAEGGTTSSGGTWSTAGSGGASGGAGGVLSRVPKNHRAVATPCDSVRPTYPPPALPVGGDGACRSDADCTIGVNGRCGQDGPSYTRCTYDTCFSDADCAKTPIRTSDGPVPGGLSGPGVCGCEQGARSDYNVCLDPGGCLVDADCASGFCSPTLGDCGNFGGVTGYYCHTSSDECVDDADCLPESGNNYCAYSQVVGHWACSNLQCAG